MNKAAEVITNDPNRPTFNLSLSMVIKTPGDPEGRRVGPFLIGPSDRWSEKILRGSSVDALITISNDGPQPIRITKLISDGQAFTVKLDTLQEGKRYLITARNAPSLPLGQHVQVVKLVTESREFPELQLQLEAVIVPPVSISSETISFDDLPVSQAGYNFWTVSQSVYIRQGRGAGLEIRSVSATLPFLRIAVDTKVIGQVYLLRVGVDKTLTKGDYKGIIRVETNNPGAPVIEIPVTVTAR